MADPVIDFEAMRDPGLLKCRGEPVAVVKQRIEAADDQMGRR